MMRVVALLLSLRVATINGFYIPGENPQSFGEADVVELNVNKLTSVKTLLPLDYYSLPFCSPRWGPTHQQQNFGEFLAGDRIQSSPYYLEMKKDMYCEQLCISNLGRPEMPNKQPNEMVKAIRMNYHNNWIVDNLPSASKREFDDIEVTRYWGGFPIGFMSEDETEVTRYWGGFPIGFIHEDTKEAYVYNHVNIEIMYNPVETETNKYRVVGFTVQPFSIAHEFEPIWDNKNDILRRENVLPTVAKLKYPIESCRAKSWIHTNYDMVTAPGRKAQHASGNVLFTYDVIWKQTSSLWADRWDIYLGKIPSRIHRMGIISGLVIVTLLSAMIVAILVRNLQRDINRCNKLVTDEETQAGEEPEDMGMGWKLVHADVFHPPPFNPMLLCICCGTGAQLVGMSFFTIVFGALGFLSPARCGHLLMAVLLLYALMGVVNGYVTARLYKTLKGKTWQRATLITALAFPGLAFGLFCVMNIIAWEYESTLAVPFQTFLILLVLWFGISMPLIFAGAYFGFKQDPIEFPVHTSILWEFPSQPRLMSATLKYLIGGIFPFLFCLVELFHIMASVWMEYFYCPYGSLLLVFLILLVIFAETTVIVSYSQFCCDDYHWWGCSFANANATALYVLAYSIFYFQPLTFDLLASYILYFGYMALASLALWLMLGSVGFFSSLWFNKVIF